MSIAPGTHPGLDHLIHRLDDAARGDDTAVICDRVKRVLSEEIVGGRVQLPESFVRPSADGYARRLLHRDDGGRYAVIVMVWAPGQSTPIHDHAGLWCVECVYQGEIRVSSYELIGDAEADEVRFRLEHEIAAGVGQAGALIPPYDYHVIANADATPAVTVHVYGDEMDGCHKFHPLGDELYRREWCELGYTA